MGLREEVKMGRERWNFVGNRRIHDTFRSINQFGFHQISHRLHWLVRRWSVTMRTLPNQRCCCVVFVRIDHSFPLASIRISYSCRLSILHFWFGAHGVAPSKAHAHTRERECVCTVFVCSTAFGRSFSVRQALFIRNSNDEILLKVLNK